MLQITLKACEGSAQFQEAYEGGSGQLQEVLEDMLQSVKGQGDGLSGDMCLLSCQAGFPIFGSWSYSEVPLNKDSFI